MIKHLFAATFVARCDEQCPAIQAALDQVASEFRDGRRGLLEELRSERISDFDLCDLIMVAWAKAPLKLATGRSRDEWLDLFRSRG